MSVSDGAYQITFPPTNGVVSRHRIEDRSLMPKKIVVNPADNSSEAQPWFITVRNGLYSLRCMSASIENIDGNLRANLLPASEDEASKGRWTVTSVGAGLYSISDSGSRYWTVGTEDFMGSKTVELKEADGSTAQKFALRQLDS